MFDVLYARGAPGPARDYRGWTDPATGRDFAETVLDASYDSTIRRILALRPRRVLELGAGTGNVALAVAPRSETYVATDVSNAAVRQLNERARAAGLRQLTAERAEAVDLPTGDFDVVVVNSVAQYFPDVAYATAVLAAATERAAPDGRVFVGDVRSAVLRPVEHLDTERSRGPNGLADRVVRRVAADRELSLAPSYFIGAATERGWAAVCLLKERDSASSSLCRFRYDVVLAPRSREANGARPPDGARLDGGQHVVRTGEFSNPRVRELAALAAELKLAASEETHESSMPHRDPDECVAVANMFGYNAYPYWHDDTRDGRYRVLVQPAGADTNRMAVIANAANEDVPS